VNFEDVKTGSYYTRALSDKSTTYCYLCNGISPSHGDVDNFIFSTHPYPRIGLFPSELTIQFIDIPERMDYEVIHQIFSSREFEDLIKKSTNIEFK